MTSERKTGQAGTLESCDARVTIELTDEPGIDIEVEGPMKDVFGDAVARCARETLENLGVNGARVKLVDRGALDYVISARVEAAVIRARGED